MLCRLLFLSILMFGTLTSQAEDKVVVSYREDGRVDVTFTAGAADVTVTVARDRVYGNMLKSARLALPASTPEAVKKVANAVTGDPDCSPGG